jgi:cysteine-rich repeat protein
MEKRVLVFAIAVILLAVAVDVLVSDGQGEVRKSPPGGFDFFGQFFDMSHDVNFDGKTDVFDVIAIIEFELYPNQNERIDIMAGDVNRDGIVNGIDAMELTIKIVGGQYGMCGDEVLQQSLGEECDDGNLRDGDGCSRDCRFDGGPIPGPGGPEGHLGGGVVPLGNDLEENEIVYLQGGVDEVPWVCDGPFIRGDANGNGDVTLVDALRIFQYGFVEDNDGGLVCVDAGDADDGGNINVVDALRVLNYLYDSSSTYETIPEQPFWVDDALFAGFDEYAYGDSDYEPPFGDVALNGEDDDGDGEVDEGEQPKFLTAIEPDSSGDRLRLNSLDENEDGGYIAAGYIREDATSNWNLYLVKLDANGGVKWEQTYDDLGSAFSIQEIVDDDGEGDGYIVTGVMSDEDIFLAKIDSDGDTCDIGTDGSCDDSTTGLFVKIFDDFNSGMTLNSDETTSPVIQTFDEDGYPTGFILAGEYILSSPVRNDVWVVKTDVYGDTCDLTSDDGICEGTAYEIFANTFDYGDFESSHSIFQTSDGGFVVLDLNNPGRSLVMIKLDEGGDLEFDARYSGGGIDPVRIAGTDIDITSDGGYVVLGTIRADSGEVNSLGNPIWNSQYWVMETDEDFETCDYDEANECEGIDGTFVKMFGDEISGDGVDEAFAIATSYNFEGEPDGYLVVGESSSFGTGSELWIVKMDTGGNTCNYIDNDGECSDNVDGTFAKIIEDVSELVDVIHTEDGGFAMVGWRGRNAVVLKIDEFGEYE